VVAGEGGDELEGEYKLDDYIALCGPVCRLVVVVSFEGKFVEHIQRYVNNRIASDHFPLYVNYILYTLSIITD